jgi:hypothetical protein
MNIPVSPDLPGVYPEPAEGLVSLYTLRPSLSKSAIRNPQSQIPYTTSPHPASRLPAFFTGCKVTALAKKFLTKKMFKFQHIKAVPLWHGYFIFL